jgi:hypothetical protein
MTRVASWLAVAAVVWTSAAEPTHASVCLGLCDDPPRCEGLEAAVKSSALVFHGKVKTVAKPADHSVVTFAVDRVWKGDRGRVVEVHTGVQSALLAIPFEKDREYLVFAVERDGVLHSNVCSLTSAIEHSGSRVRRLEDLRRRQAKKRPRPS